MDTRVCKTVYSFEELSDAAKEKAIDRYREHGLDYDWWDAVYENAKNIGALMGIRIDNIYFSGFSYQGDGACFEGEYEYQKGSVKAVMDYAPQDKKLHTIVKRLQREQRKNFYGLSAHVEHKGHYSHEFCTVIDVSDNRDNAPWRVADDVAEEIKDLLRDFMNWIYRSLEKEYDYLNSEEVISKLLIANEYDFLDNGELYY